MLVFQLTEIRDLVTTREPMVQPGQRKKTGVPGAPSGFVNATTVSEIIAALVLAYENK